MQNDAAPTEQEQNAKLATLGRLLNDPDVPMQQGRVWSILNEWMERERALT